MKASQKAILTVLLVLLLAALAAIVSTHQWASSPAQLKANREQANKSADVVDTRSLETAQQLLPLAVTSEEQEYAQEALRLADKSVDYAFETALRDAQENPAPLTPETRELSEHLKQARADVGAEEDHVAELTAKLAHARASAKDDLQQQLEIAQAQLELDKDEADDIHLDLIRAGGDKRATIQQQLDRHEASSQHGGTASALSARPPSPEGTASANLLSEFRAWWSLRTKAILLQEARQNALDRLAVLAVAHESLKKQVSLEKSQKRIIHKKISVSTRAVSAGSQPQPQPQTQPQSQSQPEAQPAEAAPPTVLVFVKELSQHQKILGELDQRIESEHYLSATYGSWLALVTTREHVFLHALFRSAFWIFLIALLVFMANFLIQKFFADITPERRQLHTLRAAILLGVQAFGIVLILLVIFGVPSNFATVAALAGAGLTVALKDFIVGFLGWFVLMGKDGIRAGDWVEINGVGGEVVEVGPLHTVLLETGNWTDAAHPTGRKVTFVNSFAIEGHYFNFSTSGQWLWDELEVLVLPPEDPYPIAEAIQKIAAEDTAANAALAEKEWERVTPSYAKRSFSAAPSMTVRPTAAGVNVLVRYLTRASERAEIRARLYRAVVDILGKRNISAPATADAPPQSVGNRTI
ncbi:MAG: mechanosensitive ion channel domain-containing protein [Candidatus Acidiferrales bacterium]